MNYLANKNTGSPEKGRAPHTSHQSNKTTMLWFSSDQSPNSSINCLQEHDFLIKPSFSIRGPCSF